MQRTELLALILQKVLAFSLALRTFTEQSYPEPLWMLH